MSRFKIHPLQTARTVRHMNYLTYLRNFGRDVEMFYGAFLLCDDSNNILVDTGCDAKSYSAGPMPPVEDVESLENNLKKFNLDIKDVDAVILTHLHFDHTAFLKLFSHCPKIVQKKELISGMSPHPYFSNLYVSSFYKDIKFEVIDGDVKIYPGIEVALVPGHSAGCQAVIVDTKSGKAAISGFCCVSENFETNNPAIPGIHEDVQQAFESMNKLINMADIIYPVHSPANPVYV